MSGLRSITVGKSGCGKTTYSKKMLNLKPEDIPVIVYDINQEYRQYYNEKY